MLTVQIQSMGSFEMAIDKKEIERLSNLAAINLTATELAEMRTHLERVLAHFESLTHFDPEPIDPENNGDSEMSYLRQDIVVESFSQATALENAPNQSGGFFSVPKVLSQKLKTETEKGDE